MVLVLYSHKKDRRFAKTDKILHLFFLCCSTVKVAVMTELDTILSIFIQGTFINYVMQRRGVAVVQWSLQWLSHQEVRSLNPGAGIDFFLMTQILVIYFSLIVSTHGRPTCFRVRTQKRSYKKDGIMDLSNGRKKECEPQRLYSIHLFKYIMIVLYHC